VHVRRSLVAQLQSGDGYALVLAPGFGDVAPASDGGRGLVALEIVRGQLYLVTVVAVILTAATRRQLRQGRDDPPAA
jgi:hypothetical protein